MVPSRGGFHGLEPWRQMTVGGDALYDKCAKAGNLRHTAV